jgi:hypothetical protein
MNLQAGPKIDALYFDRQLVYILHERHFHLTACHAAVEVDEPMP